MEKESDIARTTEKRNSKREKAKVPDMRKVTNMGSTNPIPNFFYLLSSIQSNTKKCKGLFHLSN